MISTLEIKETRIKYQTNVCQSICCCSKLITRLNLVWMEGSISPISTAWIRMTGFESGTSVSISTSK